MSRTVTLTVLLSDVRTKGDFAGAQVRHTDAQITRLLNQSIQLFRERISDEGSTHYLVASNGTLGVGPTSPYPFYQLDLSAVSPSLVRTYGIDVTFPGGNVETLQRVPFEDRAKYGTTQQGGRPVAWAHFRTDQVAILPASDTAYAYTVWYLPKFTDLSAGSDTFDGVAGWEDFIVWDVVAQLIARDQFPQAFGIAESRRNTVWENIIRSATKVSHAGGAHIGRDSLAGKLPYFLGGSRPVKAAVGGPMIPAPGSVTDAMLADMTGPTVKGVTSGTTRPYSVGMATLTVYLAQFSSLRRGVVPLSDGLATSFLAGDGVWRTPAGGGGAGNSVGPSGAIQYQAGTGFAGASGFRIYGASPSLLAHIDGGSLRVTGGEVAVGSGTTRIQSTGIDGGNGSIINVATLVGQDASLKSLALQTGLAHSQLQPLGSGTVLGNLSGTGAPSPVAVATLHAFAPTFTSTRPGIVPESGGGSANFLRADGVWAAPSSASSPTGVTNSQLADMPTGTVKARLTGTGAPQDVPLATLLAFAPTFTSARAGIVPESGGGTSNYLRADGAWATPPGGSSTPGGITGNIQYNSAGSFEGYSGISIATNNFGGLAFGDTAVLSAAGVIGDVRIATGFTTQGRTASGGRAILETWAPSSRLLGWGSNGAGALVRDGILQMTWDVASSVNAVYAWRAGSEVRMRSSATGFDLAGPLSMPTAPAYVQAISVVSGIGNQFLDPMGSGLVKANLSGTGTPQDVSIATLFAFSPTFTATRTGDVPASGGGTTNFLRADGSWAAPPGGTTTAPSGPTFSLQFNNSGAFDGATGIKVVASGQALLFGASGPLGFFNPAGQLSSSATGVAVAGPLSMPTGVLNAQALTVVSGIGNQYLDNIGSGLFKGRISGTGTPQDVSLMTMLAFAPTFTSARAGIVPQSDGLTTSFLAGDGVWRTPAGGSANPGGRIGNIQFNTGVGFGGASGFNFTASGAALQIGVPSLVADMGDVRVGSGFTFAGRNASGIAQPFFDFWVATGSLRFGSSGLARIENDVASGGVQEFTFGGATATSLLMLPTGIHAPNFHSNIKSLTVGNINGLPFDFAGLKRGLDFGTSSGLPSGISLYLPRGAGSGANRYIIPSGAVGTGTVTAPRFVTLSPTGGKGGNIIRIERQNDGGWPFEVRTPTGTTLFSFPSGTKHWADFMFEKPSGAVFQHAGAGDLF